MLFSPQYYAHSSQGQSDESTPEIDKTPSVQLSQEEQTWLNDHPSIKFGFTDAFEPAVITNKDGTYRGTLVDFLTLLNQRLGTDFKIILGPIPVMFKQVQDKELAGILSLHAQNADKRGFLKSHEYMASYPTIFTKKGFSYNSPDDLAGKKVAVIDGVFFSNNLLDIYGKGCTIIKVKKALKGLELVKDGTVDLFIGSSRNSYLLGKYQFFDLVAAFQYYDHPTPNVFAVRNDWPQLISIINKGLTAITVAEIESIKQKWLRVPEQKITDELTGEERDWLKANPTIKVGVFPTPPYTFVKNGRNQGYLVEMMQLLAGQAGFTPEFSMKALPETFAQVKNGQLHAVLGIMRNEERAGFMTFSENVLKLQMAIFARTSRSDIRDAASLRNKIIATRKGYGLEHVVTKYLPDAKIIIAEDAEEMLQLVASGEADATIRELHSGEYILYNSFINNVNVKGLFTPPGLPETTGAEFAVSKKFPLLNSILNKAYKAIPESEKNQIWRKWFTIVESQEKTIELTPEEQAWLEQNNTVRVRAVNWPPYMIITENKDPQGIALEYLKLISERTGLRFKYEVTTQPFADFLEDMKRHQGPSLTPIIAQTPERERYLSFTVPYVSSPYVIFTREQEEIILDIRGLAGKTLGLTRGFVLQQYLEKDYPEIKRILFDNDEEGLLALSTGEIEAHIGNLTVSSYIIHKHGLSNVKVTASAPYGEQKFSMANRNDWPQLTSIINKALANITEDEKTAIRGKYIALRYEPGIDKTYLIKWILISITMIIIIMNVFVFWNWQLRRKVFSRTAELETEIIERKQAEGKVAIYQNRLKALASQLTVIEDVERRRIATGLHDHIGQILAFSRIQLARAKEQTTDEKQVRLLDETSQSLLQVIQDTKSLIFDLSSPLLNEIGLDAAITDWLENQVQKESGIECSFTPEDVNIELTEQEKTILFRNFKELVFNVMKHAQASRIDVKIGREENQMVLSVADNGSGYDPDKLDVKTNDIGGFGLLSIHERMGDIGGSLSVISEVGRGCTATLTIPIDTYEKVAKI